MDRLHKDVEDFEGENACREFGASYQANPGSLMSDAKIDMAYQLGYDGVWIDVPPGLRVKAMQAFEAGREREKRCQ